MTLQNYLYGRYAAKTARSYLRGIGNYLSACPNAKAHGHAEVAEHIGALRARYPNPRTLNTMLAAIKAYHAYLCFTGERDGDPAADVVLKDGRGGGVRPQDLFTPEELEGLLAAKTSRYGHLAARDRVLISLLTCQGLRPSEVECLRCGEIDLVGGTVSVRAHAKAEGRTLGLKAGQILLFKKYLEVDRPKLSDGGGDGAFVLGGRGKGMAADDITKHVKRRYGGMYAPRKVTATTIRLSVTSNLLALGHDVALVQSFAGHRDPASTGRYGQGHLVALRSALQTFHPFK